MKTGIFKLLESDRDRMAAHFLRLSNDDRRLRFGLALSEEALRRFARELDLQHVTGYFVAGHLVAVRFLAPETAQSFEFAISVDGEYRGSGLAQGLLQHAIEQVVGSQASIVIRHASENQPMARLCSRHPGEREREGSEIVQTLGPWPGVSEESRALELLCAAEA